MRKLKTEILIIGGGATGTGLIRDLAMRGFKTILVERGDLASGTTGRYHGLLHSGGRYVVKDPHAAKECIEENRILRKIMPQCIEDTGGFFTLTPQDDPSYAESFIQGCHKAGIPCDEVSVNDMLRAEPLLNPGITRCFRVPDASADSFLAADLNAESARQYGATILRYHSVDRLLTKRERPVSLGEMTTSQPASIVRGAICHDLVKDEEVQIEADLIVNAAGAWAGKIAASAGILVQMIPGKGILMAINHRVVNTVINRCKMPGDGDIIVPAHTVAVIGTTDVKVSDPDHFGIESWEVQLMLEEGEKLIPGFRNLRFLRAWAGVRPLYQEAQPQTAQLTSENRNITRAFTLLDHTVRDGVDGLLTITGGKWTTYRKMAEVTADKVCEKFGVDRPCRTYQEQLPATSGAEGKNIPGAPKTSIQHHVLGHRLEQIETSQAYGSLICECELATREDVAQAIHNGNIHTIDDIRRDIRLGMGPCQSGFCTLRAAGLLHQLAADRDASFKPVGLQTAGKHEHLSSIGNINGALRDFLQERWKGLLPVLWGQQLRQERLDELIYLDVLNAAHLPGPRESNLSPWMYQQEEIVPDPVRPRVEVSSEVSRSALLAGSKSPRQADVLIVGAGLAGLITAWRAVTLGKKVKLISKGWGATHWGSGCIDVFGYSPLDPEKVVLSPEDAINELITARPNHPYALAGLSSISKAIRDLTDMFAQAGYPMHGQLDRNWMLPTALGAIRPTCLAPETMIAGDIRVEGEILISGFDQYLDFYPALVADNLVAQNIPARSVMLHLPGLEKRRFVNAMSLARLFDQAEFREEVIKGLKPELENARRVGFPAVLGLHHPLEAIKDLERQLGCAVFEIPGLPPSIPGIRMHNLLTHLIQRGGGQVYDGMQVVGKEEQGLHLQAVLTEAASGVAVHPAQTFVLATGGILGGGITLHPPGYMQNMASETAFGMPLRGTEDLGKRFQTMFLGQAGHPIFRLGVEVNSTFQPIDSHGVPLYDNLFVIGGTLAHFDPIRERSLEGVAVVTGYCIGQWMD